VLAVVSVLAALLAADVRSWHSALAQGDALYAATPKHVTWTPHNRLGASARTLLGLGSDIELRRALQLYVAAATTPNRLDTAVELQAARAQAESALAKVARGPHASQADTLLGILAFESTSGAEAATADFTDAVRADPANAAAKFDLELLLRLAVAHGTRTGAGAGGSVGAGGRRGAGGGVPGGGY
jgi:hypothetical protein